MQAGKINVTYQNGRLKVFTPVALKHLVRVFGALWKSDHFLCPPGAVLDLRLTLPEEHTYWETEAMQFYEFKAREQEMLHSIVNGHWELEEHDFLMNHQKIARALAKMFPRFALFMDTGTGKTITGYQIMTDRGGTWQVLAPRAVCMTGWWEDHEEFYPDFRVFPDLSDATKVDYQLLLEKWDVPFRYNARKSDLYNLCVHHAEILVTNPERFKTSSYQKAIKKKKFDGAIFDESIMLKNASSEINKVFRGFASTIPYCYIMTGKGSTKDELDYFGQFLPIDTSIFGTNYHRARNKYFQPADHQGFKWVAKEGAKEVMAKRIARKSYIVHKADCLDLPPVTEVKREVVASKQTMLAYKSMMELQMAILEDTSIMADTKVASLMKLRQICSGFIINEDGEVEDVGKEKLTELGNVLNELGDQPVVIWCAFREEVRQIKELLGEKAVTAYGADTGRSLKENLRMFKDAEAQYLIAHPGTLKYGVTLTGKTMTKNCSTAIYFSVNNSYDDWYQSKDRINRKGQFEPVTLIYLQMALKGSMDKHLYANLMRKGSNSDLIEGIVKDYHASDGLFRGNKLA